MRSYIICPNFVVLQHLRISFAVTGHYRVQPRTRLIASLHPDMMHKAFHKNKLQIYVISPKNTTQNFAPLYRRKATPPLPYRCQKFIRENSHIKHTPTVCPNAPISNPIFTLMDFFGSFQLKKRSKMTLLTLETDFFGPFQVFSASVGMVKTILYFIPIEHAGPLFNCYSVCHNNALYLHHKDRTGRRISDRTTTPVVYCHYLIH